MNFDEYEQKAGTTAVYPNRGSNIVYPALKLAGESGEVAEKVGKFLRGDYGQMRMGGLPPDLRDHLVKELGDVLWYVAAMCHEINVPMSTVAEKNIEKLASRKERGVIRGSGDDR
jgi:NTP pyrophosphatase (non-canonical NTP hydrolase)